MPAQNNLDQAGVSEPEMLIAHRPGWAMFKAFGQQTEAIQSREAFGANDTVETLLFCPVKPGGK